MTQSVKRIDKLTPEQEARMSEWRDKWIEIGLSTARADRPKFEVAVKECYRAAGLAEPKTIIWVSSPIVGAFAAPYAQWILNQRGATGDAVDDAVDDAVRDAVDGAVGGAVRDAVDDAVDGASEVLSYINDRRWNRMGGQFWVGGWYGSPSYTSFFREVCNLDLGEDINNRARAYQETSESACWWWPYTDFVMVCERPEVIHLENGRLHSDHEMAIRWPDGWGLYFLDGVRFEKEEWEKIINQTFTLEDLAREGMGADKSAVAIKYLKPDLLLKHCNAELINTGVKGTRLYEVKNFMNTGITQYCMRMKHPSIEREYIEWVRPEIGKQADADLCQAAAWVDKDGDHIPVEDYLLAIEA